MTWVLGVVIPLPFLWMTNYDQDRDECDLNITLAYLIYTIGLNVIFEFIPMFLHTYLYICIIINNKKNYNSFQNMFGETKTKSKTKTARPTDVSIKVSDLKKVRIKKKVSFKRTLSTTSTYQESKLSYKSSVDKNFLNETFTCDVITKNDDIVSKKQTKKISLVNTKGNRLFKSQSSSSLASMDFVIKLKAKRKYESTAHISIMTILSFWCQAPIRLFICWSCLNSYLSKFELNDYETLIDDNYDAIIIYYNFASFIYLLNIVFNCIIYNIYCSRFRKALKRFIGEIF